MGSLVLLGQASTQVLTSAVANLLIQGSFV